MPLGEDAAPGSAVLPDVFAAFSAPPADTRPMVRWWWFSGAVTTAGIDDQLASMHRSGIGGVEVAFVYPLGPDPGPEFCSPEHLDLVGHAARRAGELGLRFDLTLGSGWSYGGAHVPTELAAQRLHWDVRGIGPEALRMPLGARWSGESVVAAYVADGAPGERDLGWELLEIVGEELLVSAGTGPRVVLLAIAGPTGQQVKRSAAGAEGPVLDHFSRAATEHHLQSVAEPLLAAAGPEQVTAVFCDSLEVYRADWTPTVLEEFRARRGYDPLPVLFRLQSEQPEGAGLRADYYRTLSELQEENFLATVHTWAREHGVAFRVQNYGQPPARVSGYRHADLIEGEGWGWRGIPETKWASSAAHHLGTAVVSSETWTWVNSPSFRARPIDLQGEAHEHLLSGVNQFIGHGWPYSPRDAVDPGWAFYAAGALCDRNAWWAAAPALLGYLSRMCAALRTGEHVADVALWLPYQDSYAGFGPQRAANLWKDSTARIGDQVPAALRAAGYDFDVVDAQTSTESIVRRHRAVVLAGSTMLSADDERQLAALRAAGVPVLVVDADVLPEATHVPADELVTTLGTVVAPDLVVDAADVAAVHRSHEHGELYAVANTGPEPVQTTVQPRQPYRSWEIWDGRHGRVVRRGTGPILLALAPYQALLVVTSPEAPGTRDEVADAAGGVHRSHRSADRSGVPPIPLPVWQLTDPQGGSRVVTMPHVWEEDGLDGVVGTATYTSTVVLSEPLPADLVLDPTGLPVPARTARQPQSFQARAAEPVGVVAQVRVNGHDAGVLWCHPYRLAVGHLLHPGENRIELAVSGTSVAGMRSAEWRAVYEAATAAYGRRFTMQEIDQAVEPTCTGVFVVPQLV